MTNEQAIAKAKSRLSMCDYQSETLNNPGLREAYTREGEWLRVVLPCNVGDAVWTNFSIQGSYLRKTDRPYECRVLFVGLNESDSGGYINFEYVKSGYQFQMDFDQIGKTVFLTRNEAEAALGKEREK